MRRVTPPDHPWGGLLVRAGEESLVLVPTEALGESWPGWGAQPGGHVIAPIDIVRRSGGHDVVMPPCPSRLADVVLRRRDEGRPLDAGEAITVAVSILRGVDELQTLGASAAGEWWIADGGMPVLAAGAAFARAGAQEGADIVRAMLPCDPTVDAALEDTCAALQAHEATARTFHQLEQRLFACAEPTALATSVLTPRRARAADGPVVTPDDVHGPRRGLFQRLGHHVDDDLADVVVGAVTAAWRGVIRPRRQSRRARGRRRPVLAGMAIAGIVVTGGLLWPGDDDPPPADAATPAATTIDATEGPADAGTGEADADQDDLAAIASDLLTQRNACTGDPVCLADVVEDPSAVHPGGVIDLGASRRTVTLLDEFGGAAVLRAEATGTVDSGSSAQFVVMVVREGRWLIRDVHDVADQP